MRGSSPLSRATAGHIEHFGMAIVEAETPLTSPVLDADGQLFVCSNLQGKVHHVAEGDGASQLAVRSVRVNVVSLRIFEDLGS